MMVILPGEGVSTTFYKDTAKAIQVATKLNLWVVIPSFKSKKCTDTCKSPSNCSTLKQLVDNLIGKAVDQGFSGSTQEFETYVAGHSLGGMCADNLVMHMLQTKTVYKALVLMGSYVAE